MTDGFAPPRWEGDKRPDFAAGNRLSVRSGAWSPRLVTDTMSELAGEFQATIDAAPWIRSIDERGMLDYLRDAARLERLERWLHEHGDRYPDDDDKNPGELRDRDLREVASLRRRCMEHRARLGLDPASRARMNLDRSLHADLAAVWAADEDGDPDAAA